MKLYNTIDFPKNDSSHYLKSKLEVSGWCFFENTPGRFLEVRLNNRIIFINKFNKERPDVLNVYPQAKKINGPLGFRYFLDLPSDLTEGRHTMSFYVLDDTNIRKEIKTTSIDMYHLPPAGDFSQRFSHIPEKLVLKVNGSTSEETFKNIGNEVAGIIEQNFDAATFKNFNNVLDFGCGLGRVMYPMSQKLPQSRFVGFDIDQFMIKWITYLFSDLKYKFTLSTVDLEDSQFDFLYAISVFTHLNKTTDYWLAEIHRILKKDGYAFLTYHDDTLFEEKIGTSDVPHIIDKSTLKDCYVVGSETPEGSDLMGTYYTTSYWIEKLEKYFTVVSNAPRGLFGHQSFTIVTPKDIKIDRELHDREYITMLEKEIQQGN